MLPYRSTSSHETHQPPPGSQAQHETAVPEFIRSKYLLRQQARAAVLTIVVPSAATLLAIYLALSGGIAPRDIALLVVFHLATMLGITVGYHRLYAHKAFRAGPRTRRVLLSMGAMAAQGPPIQWVCNHRLHHQYSDEAKDLHSPHAPSRGWRGFAHAHVGWMFSAAPANPAQYGRDLLQDPQVQWVNRHYAALVVAGLLMPAAIGMLLAGGQPLTGALTGLLWGGLVRIFTVHHATWSTNSITHMFGTRAYRSDDKSTNVAWLAVPSAGESWHNCHHAFPRSARFGLRWWQLDLGWVLIRTLEKMRCATEVHVPDADAQAARSQPHRKI